MQGNKLPTIPLPATSPKRLPADSQMSMAWQFLHLLRLLLRFKAYRFATFLVAGLLMHSHLIVSLVSEHLFVGRNDKLMDISHGVTLYNPSEFASAGYRVLIDRLAFPAEVELAASLMSDNGGSTSWIKPCSSESSCRAEFVGQHDTSVVAYFRYAKHNGTRSVLECLWVENPTYICTTLYQLMAQSTVAKISPHDAFEDVQFFTFNDVGDGERTDTDSNSGNKKPDSICSSWIYKANYDISVPLILMTLGVSFFILFTTVSFIHSIKMAGFYQQLVRNGFSVTCYWTIIWIVTVSECLIFSALFVLSHYIPCSAGTFVPGNMARVFAMLSLLFIQLATAALLLQMLIPSSIVALSLFMIVICLFLNILFDNQRRLTKKYSFIGNILPQIFVKNYIETYVTSGATTTYSIFSSEDVENHTIYNNSFKANIATAVALIIATNFLDFILANGNGMRLPLYFPFMWKFWSPEIEAKADRKVADTEQEPGGPHIEPVIAGLTPSITVDRVSKSYWRCPCLASTRGPQVLEKLSCKIYKNEITALIGHNGAGKSTLIKILTGEENPESGVAYIGGINTTDPIERLALRGSISTCPQFDALCETLSVIECIQITLASKGIGGHSELERARSMLKRLGLGDKENVMSTDLSGGQKRKVSTILALLGDTKVVFLDEPTSGLDPVSRRQLWQLLQEEKLGRSIVLCTQFMDEADILADRKIFLCGGNIVCAGSSMFLKRAFGCNSTISVSLKSESEAQKLLPRLQQVQVKSQFKTELQLEIPASKPSALISTVQTLEDSNEVEAFGLSQANLDDAFMKLSGVSSNDVIDAFRSGNLSKLQKRQEINATGQVMEELSQSLQRSVNTKPSIVAQFLAMVSVNLKKQWRTSSTFWSRYVVSAALLLNLALYIGTMKMRTKSGKVMMNNGIPHQTSGIDVVCLHDEGYSMASFNQSCESLSLGGSNYFDFDSIEISKPKDKELNSFLQEKSTRDELRQKCKVVKGSCERMDNYCRICVLVYASTWNTSEVNSHRKIAIGVYFHQQWSKVSTLPALTNALKKIWIHFGQADLDNSMTTLRLDPLSEFTYRDSVLIMVALIFCLFSVSYLSDPTDDMTSGVRSQLLSMGMAYSSYWMNLFFLHWVQYSLCLSISVGILFLLERYRHWQYFVYAIVPVMIFGTTSNQLLMYLVANITRTKNSFVVLANIAAGVCIGVVYIFYSSIALTTVLIVLLPPIAPIALIVYGLLPAQYKRQYYMADSMSSTPHAFDNYWSHSYIIWPIVMMPVHVVLLCGILVLTEYKSTLCGPSSPTKQHPVVKGSDKKVDQGGSADQGAQKEQNRLMQTTQNADNVLEVRQLSKTYPNGVHAVRGVTFGVMSGEIFGLLGANGAGKSTSLSVIVGEDTDAGGSVLVRSRDGRWEPGRSAAAMGVTGYCPQHNPLFDFVTVAEHLALYAAIRGVPSSDAQSQADALMRGLQLQEHRDKSSSQLSGGNKRRLCLAIALLGDPNLIVIDEGSTGVDPENKRFIWAAIRGIMRDQRGVLVTTHSMEEVEALCNRVAIMNRGRIISFGTVQQIRSLYGDAYTLDVLLAQDKSLQQKKSGIKTAVAVHFKGAALLEDLGLCLQFGVPKKSVVRLSDALKWLDANQSKLGMLSYSFCQMSLDQVFVKLVKQFDSSLHD